MSLSKAVKGEKKQSEPQRGALECVAHGCPLPGVYRVSNESSICRAHDEQSAVSWGTIPNRVRNRIDSLSRALELTNATPGQLAPKSAERYFVEAHGQAFAVREGANFAHGAETARSYGTRVFGMLLDECRGDAAPAERLPARSPAELEHAAKVIERIAP
jgi:hypothetical protein